MYGKEVSIENKKEHFMKMIEAMSEKDLNYWLTLADKVQETEHELTNKLVNLFNVVEDNDIVYQFNKNLDITLYDYIIISTQLNPFNEKMSSLGDRSFEKSLKQRAIIMLNVLHDVRKLISNFIGFAKQNIKNYNVRHELMELWREFVETNYKNANIDMSTTPDSIDNLFIVLRGVLDMFRSDSHMSSYILELIKLIDSHHEIVDSKTREIDIVGLVLAWGKVLSSRTETHPEKLCEINKTHTTASPLTVEGQQKISEMALMGDRTDTLFIK